MSASPTLTGKVGWTEVHGQRRLESPAKRGTATVLLREVSPGKFDVTALDGHELLPGTKSFTDEAEARRYANQVWARW